VRHAHDHSESTVIRAHGARYNSVTSFTYDADHNRIREVNANGTTLFVNPGNALLFEKQSNLGTDNFSFGLEVIFPAGVPPGSVGPPQLTPRQ
jgi:YD repeat-containing protein